MTNVHQPTRLLLVLTAISCVGCNSQHQRGDGQRWSKESEWSYLRFLDKAAELELVAIDPGAEIKAGDHEFFGYKELGRTVIKEAATLEEVCLAVYRSADEGTTSAWCFEPRHAIRVHQGGKDRVLLICFECSLMRMNENQSESFSQLAISSFAEPILNKMLLRAGIPLADKAKSAR